MHKTALEARVAAYNRVNKEANEMHPDLIKWFAPFVGKKVLLNGGELSKKIDWKSRFEPFAPEGVYPRPLRMYRNSSTYSLSFTLQACEKFGENSNHYADAHLYIGRLSDGILLELETPITDRRADYRAEEILRWRKITDEKEKDLRNAEAMCSPFGRYDR